MTWRRRRRGLFEGPPRVRFRRTGARYFDAAAVAMVLNGVVVAGFGVVTVALYVDASSLAVFAACWVAAYVVEGVVAGVFIRRIAEPARSWLEGDRTPETTARAWSAAARLPVELVRRRSLYAIGAAGAAAAALVLAAELELPAREAALLFPTTFLLYLSSAVLRFIALELAMRPVLETVAPPEASPPPSARLSLHRRLLATVPMVSWGT